MYLPGPPCCPRSRLLLPSHRPLEVGHHGREEARRTLDPVTDRLIGLRRLAVPPLSPAGIAVMSEMSSSGQRPRVLRDAVRAGRVPDGDLPELIPFAWTRADEPTSDISEADWLEIFRHAGFFSYPPISGGGRPVR